MKSAIEQIEEALEASVDDIDGINRMLGQQVVDLQAQLEAAAVTRAQLDGELRLAKLEMRDLTTARDAAFREIGELRKIRDDLQAQLEAAAVTSAQQPDGNAERLERVQRMIGEIRGWYTCVDWMEEKSPYTWDSVGVLLGRLQREAE